jgi:hypothetical protein
MRVRTFFRVAAAAAGFVLGLGTLPVANAAIVTQWSVGVQGQFLCSTAAFTPSSGGTSCNTLHMNWGTGTGSGQSGLDITNPVAPTLVNTNGPAVANLSVTHRNEPITGNSLDQVTLQSTLTLTPNVPPLPGLAPASLNFLINFQETPNADNPCDGGGLNGVGVNVNGCADIFVIDQSSLNFPFQYDTDGAGGDPLVTYFISFFELTGGLNPLPAVACSAVGVDSPCLGFRTPEEQDTTFQFAAVITTEPVQITVPEPGTLALIAGVLFSLGLLVRRGRV